MVNTHFLLIFLVFLKHPCFICKFTAGLRNVIYYCYGCYYCSNVDWEWGIRRNHRTSERNKVWILLGIFSFSSTLNSRWWVMKCPHHGCPPWEAGFWILRIIYLGPYHMLRDPVIHTDVLFPMFLISPENWRFLFQGLIYQALSPSHLTATVSSPWATLATHLSVKPRQFLQMCLEEKQFVWGCLCFFASKKRHNFSAKAGPGWTVGACV